MKIEHIALWVKDLEIMKAFYLHYFDMICNDKYINKKKEFSSYFLSFKNSETRIELMHRPDIFDFLSQKGLQNGLTHFAISVGSKEKVDSLTEKLRKDGYIIQGEPRTTGDGYYESVVLDPENNPVEITV